MKQLKLFSCSAVIALASLAPHASFAEASMSGFLKSRQITVQPNNDIQAMLIEQIDSDTTCKSLTPTILLKYDKSFDKKTLKKQIKTAKNHKFKLTKKETSKKHTLLSTHYSRTIIPEKQGELTNFLNVEVNIKLGDQHKCTHFYGYRLDNGIWKSDSKREIEHTK